LITNKLAIQNNSLFNSYSLVVIYKPILWYDVAKNIIQIESHDLLKLDYS